MQSSGTGSAEGEGRREAETATKDEAELKGKLLSAIVCCLAVRIWLSKVKL
jgi:hypothetical protein